MAATEVIVEEFDDLGFTLTEPQIIDRLVSEILLVTANLNKALLNNIHFGY